MEHRLVLLRHVRGGTSDKGHGELAVGIRGGGAVRDFLSFRLRRIPPAPPEPPDRIPHLAHHPVTDLGPANRGARVSLGGSLDLHVPVEFGRLGGSRQLDFEFRTLVFLHIEERDAVVAFRITDPHLAHEPIARRGEAAAERTEVVRAMLLLLDLLTVRVFEDHRDRLVGLGLVVVALLIHRNADPFELDGLPRPIQRSIGEEDRLLVRLCFFEIPIGIAFAARGQRRMHRVSPARRTVRWRCPGHGTGRCCPCGPAFPSFHW